MVFAKESTTNVRKGSGRVEKFGISEKSVYLAIVKSPGNASSEEPGRPGR